MTRRQRSLKLKIEEKSLALALFKPKERATHPNRANEPRLEKVEFNIYKFGNRSKPRQRDRILIIGCFSEFGCETVGAMYCLPRLLRRFPGRYVIVMGWYGREYLYRHLVDEFWEVKEDFMWLRDRVFAFHHQSTNLKHIEEAAAAHGSVIPSATLGTFAVTNFCKTCGKTWNEWRVEAVACPGCKSTVVVGSIFGSVAENKEAVVKIPKPSKEVMDWAGSIVKPKTVGIVARARTTYGRNLPPEFYAKLINKLEGMGYNIIWLGEKQSTLPCPLPHIYDFSRDPLSQDLERTLAIICHCDFTIQFWTASSRLAGLMGTPFILFESPEQIYCSGQSLPGQEGKRLELTTFGPKKLVLAHYLSVLNDHETTLDLVERATNELKTGNEEDIIGMVEDRESIEQLQKIYYEQMR